MGSIQRTNVGFCLSIRDNGGGFPEEKLEQLRAQMARCKAEIDNGSFRDVMSFHGMGIVNVYTRLYIFSGGRATVAIESGKGGTEVRIECEDMRGRAGGGGA
jgi:sensor histidine kinase YesM